MATGVIRHLNQDDYICSTYRDHVHALSKGVPPREIMAELFGKKTGICRGQGGSMHMFSKEFGLVSTVPLYPPHMQCHHEKHIDMHVGSGSACGCRFKPLLDTYPDRTVIWAFRDRIRAGQPHTKPALSCVILYVFHCSAVLTTDEDSRDDGDS